MWERFAGWLVTSPIAFAVAAVVDICVYAIPELAARFSPARRRR